jgi:hypothetical protein
MSGGPLATFVANMMGIRKILRVLNTAAVSLNPG